MPLLEKIKKGLACDSVGTPDSAIGRAVCLSVHPGKMILFPFLHWFRYHYEGRYKFARLMFAVDLFLIGVVLTLSAIAIYAWIFLPKAFEDRIIFEASVAPREIITGAPATIVIRYTNTTDEELRNVQLSIFFPKHFALQTFVTDQGEIVEDNRVSLGSIAPGQSGNVRIKGVMFGDVGGEQAFQTKMTFVHGKEKTVYGEKMDWQIFQPTRSALALTLDLPERFVAFQPIQGVVRYHNESEIEFPMVSLLPEWPDGFQLTRINANVREGHVEIPSVKAGETGEFRFDGILKEALTQITFVFHPFFTFENERYRQETLTHTASVAPLPLQLTAMVNEKTLIPGTNIPVTIAYKNTKEAPVSDVTFTLESDSPFVKKTSEQTLASIEKNEEATVELMLELAPFLTASQTTIYENLKLALRGVAKYSLGDGTKQQATSISPAIERPLTTPIQLESFVRYVTPSGDQIGRGPMPPELGEETTYWVFWHIAGTINPLKNVRLEGELANTVRFTGRQTVSQNGSVSYDEKTKTVAWTSNSISPTLSPASKIVGVAFELGFTPDQKITQAPIILKNIRLTATDDFTGSFVSTGTANLKALLTNPL